MVWWAAQLTDTVRKECIEHSPWYHIAPFRDTLHSGWIMAFQRTECSLGPVTESGGTNLKSARHTSVTREIVIGRIRSLSWALSSFPLGKLLMKAT